MSTEHNSIELTAPLLAGDPSRLEDAKSQGDNKQSQVAIAITPQAGELNYFYITRQGITLRIPLNQIRQSINDLNLISLKLASWSELTKVKVKAPGYAFIVFWILAELHRPNMPTVLEDLGDTVGTVSSTISIILGIFALLNAVARCNLAHASQAKEVLSENDAAILARYIEPTRVKANKLKDTIPDFLSTLQGLQSVRALTAGGGGPSFFSASSLPIPPLAQSTSMEPTAAETERKEEQKTSSLMS